jgi:hypothetical protein
VFESVTGKTLTVAGNLINNGTIDISVGLTSAGTLTLNGTTVQSVSGSGSFASGVIRNLIFSNTNISTPNINWSIDNLKIVQNLNLTGARINLGTNKLTFGNNAAGGTLTAPVGSGFLPGGKFSRWWTATATGTTITAGGTPTGTSSRYPFLSAIGLDRAMYVTRTNATGAVAGELAATYNDATTVTSDLNIPDGTYPVTDRFNGNWELSVEGTAMSSSSYRVALFAQNGLVPANGNSRIIAQNTAIGGVHQNGAVLPVVQRISVPQADLLAAPLYVGINSDDVSYLTIANGNWNDAAIWNKGIPPACGDSAAIGAGTIVTSSTAGNVSKTVTIVIGGTLIIASGDLTTGCTLKNNSFVNHGTLTVSGGTLNINGNLMNNAGSTLNQSGGDIVIDGNDGIIANSVVGAPLLRVTATTAANLNLTGGTISILNPHRGTSTFSDVALSIAQAGTPNAASSNHTIRFGDGVSNIAGGHTSGFLTNLFVGAFHYSLGNVEVDVATGTNRFLRTSGFIGINGNLTITSGEYQMASSTIVSGNILNNGTLTATDLLGMGTFVPPNLINPSTTPQSISGTGVFRNSLTATTANLTTFEVSNSSTSGVTLNIPLSVSGNLTLTSGFLNTSSANLLTLGTSTAGGTLLVSDVNTTMIRGPFARTIATGNPANNYILFPVGKTAYSPISLAPTTTEVSVMRAEAFDTNAGTAGSGISNLSANRSWVTTLNSGLFTDTRVRLGDATIANLSIPVQATTASGAYTAAFGSTATFTAGTPNVIQSNVSVNAAAFTGFISFAEANVCSGTPAPGNTIASATTFCVGQTIVLSLQNETIGAGVSYQWKSSPNGVTYTAIAGAISPTFTFNPVVSAFYQCEVTCASGPATTISTAVQVALANTVTSTTPATRCGVGTLVLNGIPSAGATLNWYATATGGLILGSGNSFTTPSISATTNYFASAATTIVGNTTLGAGATVSTGVGGTFLPGGWGGTKTQYIIRASELANRGIAPGPMTSLGFEATTSGQAYKGFAVEMGATTQTVATETFVSGLTQVYRGTGADDAFTPVANAVNTLLFGTGTGSSNSFTWDGMSNIVVSISWSSVPNANNATASGMRMDATTFTSTNWRQRDNVTPAVMQAETVASGGTGTSRPSFTINGVILCNSPRVAVEAAVTTPPTITLSATTATVCSGSPSTAITIATGAADFDTYVWSPSTGVSGNSTSGWNFSPTVNTTYTLTASQLSGTLCSTTAAPVQVSVNPILSALTVVAAPSTVCLDQIQILSIAGGALGGSGKIGAGVLANTTSTPFRGFWGGIKTQALYTAAELTTLGLQAGQSISTIGFVALSGTPLVLNNFTINAGFVSASTLGATFIAGATNVVLAPTSYTPTTGIGNLDFPLSAPLVWDGTSNLLVETCFNNNNGGGSSANSISVESSTVAIGLNTSFSADNNPTVCTSPTANSSTTRPNLRILAEQTRAITWSPATNLFTDAAATVAYTIGTSATSVYFKSGTVGVNNYTVSATTPLNCSVTATTAITAVDCGIPYVNVQFPGTATISTCESQTFFAQVFKAGVTEAAGQGAGITAWIGRNTTNTDPATWPESSWQVATFNTQSNNNDEYQATFGPSAAGTYYVASRFVFAPGAFVYGGYEAPPSGGGIWNGTSNISAVLTVTAGVGPTAAAQSFCNTGTVADLVAVGIGIQWYAAATGGIALAGTTVLATGNYFASQTVAGCESERISVAVAVNVMAAPTGTAIQDFTAGQTLANFTVIGDNIIWYSAATSGTVLPASTVLVSGTIYYASQTVNGCESATRLAVTAGNDLRITEFEIANLRYYPNPVQNILTVDYSDAIESVQLFNMLGQMVYNKIENNTRVTIDMTVMAAGSYILEVTVNGLTKNVKVIKQ